MPSRLDCHFRSASQLFTAHGTYSPPKKALTISLPLAEQLFTDNIKPCARMFRTFQTLMDEGERSGYWRRDFDCMSGIHILIILPPAK